jgi:TadE-like protein
MARSGRSLSRHGATRMSRGQALAEFALVVPIFLLLFFGVIDIGRVVYINNALSEAAREGARWGSVQGRSNTPAAVVTHTVGGLAAVPNPTVTVTCEDVDGITASTCGINDVFTPIIAQLVGTRTYTATSKVVVNQ